MKPLLLSWQLWAVLSACFAAFTAIFAKIGVENVGSDYATFIRTIVIIIALGANGTFELSINQRLESSTYARNPSNSPNSN